MLSTVFQKKLDRRLRRIRDVAIMRVHRVLSQFNGRIGEVQKELQYELYRQYISYNVALARDKAKHEYRVIDSGDVRSFNIGFKWSTP